MILYYALGGGLGHLVRAAKLRAYYQLDEPFLLITASAYADKMFLENEVLKVPIEFQSNPKLLNDCIQNIIAQYCATELWIDCFPFGILGELDVAAIAKNVCLRYVARYVNWPVYQNKVKELGVFHNAIVVDVLHSEQQQFISRCCKTQISVDLSSINLDANVSSAKQYPGAWLIMHSGNQMELSSLKAYADDVAEAQGIRPKFVVVSQCKPQFDADWLVVDVPANIDLDSVDKIFTACGYNTMQELAPYRHKHCYMPFDRKYDDQYLRAQRARSIRVFKE